MPDRIEQRVDGFVVPAAWVVGARTMLVDRIIPRMEYLWMPATEQRGGTIALERDTAGTAPEHKRGWRALAHRVRRGDRGVAAPAGPIVDLRLNSPENWAHAQIFHLPLAQLARDWLGANPTILLTWETPGYIRRLFDHFGFSVIATNRPVAGDIVTPRLSANDVLRPARRALAAPLIADLDARRAAGKLPAGLPRKIFVVRAKTRRIANEDEIAQQLASDGFVKVLPEQMSVAEQIELFNEATEIVAIHGAALAPLLFRSPAAPPFSLVELLSPGHMATSYRLMAAQVGGRYVGVRGRIRAEQVLPAYQLDRFYTQHSLDDFSVDPASVAAARAILAEGAPPALVP